MSLRKLFCLTALLCIFITSHSFANTLLFEDNFEAGNADGWTLNAATVTSEQNHTDSSGYSMKINHGNSIALMKKTFNLQTMLDNPEITLRYWWYTAPSWVTGTGVKYLRLRGPNQIIQLELWFSEKLGSEPVSIGGIAYGSESGGQYGYWNGSKLVAPMYGPSVPYNRGRWQEFVIQYKLNTIGKHDGYLKITIDGKQVYFKDQFQFRNTNTAYTEFYIPSNIGTPNSNCINYIDDVQVLAGTGGTVTQPPPAPSDTEKPYIYGSSPESNAIDIEPNTGISFHVADKGDGVDKSSISLSVNGQSVAPNISGISNDYVVSYTPGYNFNYGEKVNVSVGGRDLAGNSFSYSYSFTVADAPLPSGATTAVFGEVSDANYPKTVTDTFININTENTLTNTSLNTYTWPDNSPANAILMKWDISALPANAKIYDAKLYLYMNQLSGTGGDSLYDLSVHKIINKNPDLTKATGYTYDGTNSWTANSLSYNGIPLAQKDIAPAADVKSIDKIFEYKSWNVTQIVKEWRATPQTNFGLLLGPDLTASSNSNRFFASSEAADASQRPKLVIIYTLDPTLDQPPAPPTGLRIIQ